MFSSPQGQNALPGGFGWPTWVVTTRLFSPSLFQGSYRILVGWHSLVHPVSTGCAPLHSLVGCISGTSITFFRPSGAAGSPLSCCDPILGFFLDYCFCIQDRLFLGGLIPDGQVSPSAGLGQIAIVVTLMNVGPTKSTCFAESKGQIISTSRLSLTLGLPEPFLTHTPHRLLWVFEFSVLRLYLCHFRGCSQECWGDLSCYHSGGPSLLCGVGRSTDCQPSSQGQLVRVPYGLGSITRAGSLPMGHSLAP